jgi:hypothetical protein
MSPTTWILDVVPYLTMEGSTSTFNVVPEHHDGVIDPSLQRPSGARQSPGGAADGDCGTVDVGLRWE